MKSIKNHKILLLLIIYLFPAILFSQNIITTAESNSTCPTEVLIPICVSNFDSVAAISLALIYEPSVLNYDNYQNLHDSLTGGFIVVNSTGDKVIISWASITPATVNENDTLLELRFFSNEGTSSFVWDTITPGSCEYSDYYGNIIPSNYINGTANVYQLPEIISHPSNSVITEGENTTFYVSATGDGLFYQWQESTDGGSIWNDLLNSAPYSGVTTATLNITNATIGITGFLYRCVVGGECPPILTSNYAMLTVDPLPQLISTTAQTHTICNGIIATPVTVVDCNGVGAISLTLAYNTSNLTYLGYQSLNPELASGNTVVNAIDGKIYFNWASLLEANVGDDILFELLFYASYGASDLIWQDQEPGSCEYSDIFGSVINSNYFDGIITIQASPAISQHPESITIIEGENADFSISATGPGLSYQWQESINGGANWDDLSNNSVYSGVTTSSLHISNVLIGMDQYLYRCNVNGACPPAISSNSAILNVNHPPQIITTTAPTIITCPGDISLPITVSQCEGVGAISLTFVYDTLILNYSGYQNPHPELSSGVLVINSSADKLIISWASLTAANIGDGTIMELNFSAQTGSSGLNWFTEIEGSCEYSDIDGSLISSAYVNGNVTVHELPSITSHPENATVFAGENTSFSITASGTGLSYQWEESIDSGANWNSLTNTPPYSGVTTNNLNITDAGIGMNTYEYRCVVSGTCSPADTSNSALLTVEPQPQVITTSIGSVSTMADTVSIPVTVTDCDSVAAISLTMDYDPVILEFIGFSDVHSELASGFLIVNANNGHCIISWASITPANVGNDTLIKLDFYTHVGSTGLIWDTGTPGNCEYSDSDGNVILSEYNDGNAFIDGIILDVKAFLEGPFVVNQMVSNLNPDYIPMSQPYGIAPWNYTGSESVSSLPNQNVVDWILMELREATGDASSATDTTVIARQAGFIQSDGSLVRKNGFSPLDFKLNVFENLFVVIMHRNHLAVMSANPLTETGDIYTHDFSTGEGQAYGGAEGHKELAGGIWGMAGGDGNADGQINVEDIDNVWALQAGNSGFISGDFTMESQVNNIDKNDIWLLNNGDGAQPPDNKNGENSQLEWRFANPLVIHAWPALFQFDVEVKCNELGTYHTQTQIYFNYDTLAFGSNIDGISQNPDINERISYSFLELMDQNKYMITNDANNTSDKYAIITQPINESYPIPLNNLTEVDTNFKGFLRFQIEIQDQSQFAGISFSDFLMDGGQYYFDIDSDTLPEKYFFPCLYENDLINDSLYPHPGIQENSLQFGYQFISSRMIVEDPNMLVLCDEILDNLDFIRNTYGGMLRKIGPIWINGIGDWATTEGYLFRMNNADTLSITGLSIYPQTPINLMFGYQMISYLPEIPINTADVFADVLNNLDFVRNSAGQMFRKIGPIWVNSIGEMQPGEGYLVRMNSDDTLVYPAINKAIKRISDIKTEYFNFEGGNAADPVFTIYIEGLDIGDEVAAYDGDKMLGATRVNSQNHFENDLPIFSTLNSGQGFKEGNPIIMNVWDVSTQSLIPFEYTMVDPYNEAYMQEVYPAEDGIYSIIEISKGINNIENAQEIVTIFPNPSEGMFNISIEGVSGKVQMKVLDVHGNDYCIFELKGTNNIITKKLDLKDLAAGVYFISFSSEDFSEVRKIVIQ